VRLFAPEVAGKTGLGPSVESPEEAQDLIGTQRAE
jgi:hypothetical protein